MIKLWHNEFKRKQRLLTEATQKSQAESIEREEVGLKKCAEKFR